MLSPIFLFSAGEYARENPPTLYQHSGIFGKTPSIRRLGVGDTFFAFTLSGAIQDVTWGLKSDPVPASTTTLNRSGELTDIAASGDILAIIGENTSGNNGVVVVDFSGGSLPSDTDGNIPSGTMSTASGFDGFEGAAISGDYLYVTSRQRLHVVDISDPLNPAAVGQTSQLTDSTQFGSILVYDDNTVLVDRSNEISTIDVSTKTAPTLTNTTSGLSIDLFTAALVGTDLFVVDLTTGKDITRLDLTDPNNPVEKETTAIPGGRQAEMQEFIYNGAGFVFLAARKNASSPTEVGVVDVSTPASIVFLDWETVSPDSTDRTVKGMDANSGAAYFMENETGRIRVRR